MDNRAIQRKRIREQRTVALMIRIYCRRQHKTKQGLCPDCQTLHDYAIQRSEKCPFLETKTFCSNCRIHCYRPEMREKIRLVMGFSGPRMLFYHPLMAVRHVIECKKEKEKLEDPR